MVAGFGFPKGRSVEYELLLDVSEGPVDSSGIVQERRTQGRHFEI